MPKPTSTWKAFERWCGHYFGCLGRNHSGNKADERDCNCTNGLAIECKHGARVVTKFILDALVQAKRNAKQGDLPFVVLHKERMRYEDSVVCIRVTDFHGLLERAGYKVGQDGDKEV